MQLLAGGRHGLEIGAFDRLKNQREISLKRAQSCLGGVALLANQIKCNGGVLAAVAGDRLGQEITHRIRPTSNPHMTAPYP